jgi:hypothetical protein
MRSLALVAVLLASVAASGCARHVHHHHPGSKKVVVLDAEHDDPGVVVVHKRPGRGRHCWKHGAHWHCRRH